ncbi:radical SAM protein [Sedimentibacter sp. B4]|uniref:radical SAM protein n=1 Tax=Sedimentibacter sp. B4 TaxID=304766 RepID=UPI000312149C|nr:radical SAM protein [Sedimentibacter sp. B4]
MNLMKECIICPRNCKVDRTKGNRGYCRETDKLVVARASLHMWEEPCISGTNGSGTVFFSGCSLGCIYCQNFNISNGMSGKEITTERLAEIFLELQSKGAHNINLVTPTHFVVQIMDAIIMSRNKGLNIPIVYNTSGYEKIETIKMLEGHVSVYLPDLKYMDENIAKKYSNCQDYFSHASKAIEEMVRQTGEIEFDENGMVVKGVIVRHMTLPGYLDDSKNIIRYLHETYKHKIYLSIMNQYTPLTEVSKYPEINRKITEDEYDELVDYAVDIGVENGFIQEGETALESFIPVFDKEGV